MITCRICTKQVRGSLIDHYKHHHPEYWEAHRDMMVDAGRRAGQWRRSEADKKRASEHMKKVWKQRKQGGKK